MENKPLSRAYNRDVSKRKALKNAKLYEMFIAGARIPIIIIISINIQKIKFIVRALGVLKKREIKGIAESLKIIIGQLTGKNLI